MTGVDQRPDAGGHSGSRMKRQACGSATRFSLYTLWPRSPAGVELFLVAFGNAATSEMLDRRSSSPNQEGFA